MHNISCKLLVEVVIRLFGAISYLLVATHIGGTMLVKFQTQLQIDATVAVVRDLQIEPFWPVCI